MPAALEWFHEIKFDGYRLRLERVGERVRLITKGGYDWTKRLPWIVEAALKNRQRQFVIDGEAVISWASTAAQISTPFIRINKTTKSSYVLSTCWRWVERIFVPCRFPCASKALGVTVPPSLLTRADEVVE